MPMSLLERLLMLMRDPEGAASGEGDTPAPKKPTASARREADDGDVGDDDPVVSGDRWREPTPYERTLRKESQKYRTRAKEAAEQLEAFKAQSKTELEAAIAKAKQEAEAAVNETKAKADARYISFELKAALKDAECEKVEDALKLIDASAIKLNEAGEVVGVKEVVEAFKKDKTFLFKTAPASSSSEAPKPKSGEPSAKTALEMTAEEYAAERASFTGTRRRG